MSRLPASYDDWRTDPDYGLSGNDIRERIAQEESDQEHADCLVEMLSAIAQIAQENLTHYNIGIADKDVVEWLRAVHDNLIDNLLWQDWGNASDYLPSDRDAMVALAWKAAKEDREDE